MFQLVMFGPHILRSPLWVLGHVVACIYIHLVQSCSPNSNNTPSWAPTFMLVSWIVCKSNGHLNINLETKGCSSSVKIDQSQYLDPRCAQHRSFHVHVYDHHVARSMKIVNFSSLYQKPHDIRKSIHRSHW